MKKRISILLTVAAIIAVLASCTGAGMDNSLEMDGSAARLLIPANAEIVSAELYLYVSNSSISSVDLHTISKEWDVSTVTWNNFNLAYKMDPFSHMDKTEIGWNSVDIKPYIIEWINGTSPYNYGFLLEMDSSDYLQYYGSRVYGAYPELAPYIKMTYMISGNILVDDPEYSIEDVYIWENMPDTNYGTWKQMFVGYIAGYKKQTLIKFDLEEEPGELVGCGTPGYWKNHPDAWPVEEITIGGVTYSKEEAINEMSMPVKKDKWYSMFRTLVAAKLNVFNGTPNVVADTIAAADEWMTTYHHLTVNGLEIVTAKSDAWAEGSEYHSILDDYNNGLIEGAPSRDDLE